MIIPYTVQLNIKPYKYVESYNESVQTSFACLVNGMSSQLNCLIESYKFMRNVIKKK